MCLLAIESSTRLGSIALLDAAGAPLFEESFASDRRHNVDLFAPLEKAVKILGGASLAMVVVGCGPGSYTGVRIGLAAADGLALGYGTRMVSLSSLLALSDADDFDVVGDARRGSFYLASIRKGRMVGPPELLPIDSLEKRLESLCQLVLTADETPLHPALTPATPHAIRLGRRWLALEESERQQLMQVPCEPIYLRPPQVTTPKPQPP